MIDQLNGPYAIPSTEWIVLSKQASRGPFLKSPDNFVSLTPIIKMQMKGIVKWVSAQKLSVLASFLILSYFNFKSVHKLDCHPLFRNEPALFLRTRKDQRLNPRKGQKSNRVIYLCPDWLVRVIWIWSNINLPKCAQHKNKVIHPQLETIQYAFCLRYWHISLETKNIKRSLHLAFQELIAARTCPWYHCCLRHAQRRFSAKYEQRLGQKRRRRNLWS